MNEHLKLQIGKRGTITNKIIGKDGAEIEYIQGVLRNVEEDIITIEQYIPYSEFLETGKAPSVIRTLKLGRMVEFMGVWR